jgi:hypothetical protein
MRRGEGERGRGEGKRGQGAVGAVRQTRADRAGSLCHSHSGSHDAPR